VGETSAIGERLKCLRRDLGISQRDAAAAAGMGFQYLSDLENGRIQNPSLQTLMRLAVAYSVGVDDLVGHGFPYLREELPDGLSQLLAEPEWSAQITDAWVETLVAVKHGGHGLQSKQEFLEAFLALRRILGD
jgi:transcriptional regulator with XRE-family HTH domain